MSESQFQSNNINHSTCEELLQEKNYELLYQYLSEQLNKHHEQNTLSQLKTKTLSKYLDELLNKKEYDQCVPILLELVNRDNIIAKICFNVLVSNNHIHNYDLVEIGTDETEFLTCQQLYAEYEYEHGTLQRALEYLKVCKSQICDLEIEREFNRVYFLLGKIEYELGNKEKGFEYLRLAKHYGNNEALSLLKSYPGSQEYKKEQKRISSEAFADSFFAETPDYPQNSYKF